MFNKSNFVNEHIDNIKKQYNFIKELGHGSYGKVMRAQHMKSGNIYACKIMEKKKLKDKNRFKTEVNLLKALDHPNIIKLYDIFEDHNNIYLIMEECLGGEFFDRLAKRAKEQNLYTEKDAARIFKQLLEAVNYMHAHGVCHRDLKPENILFSSVQEDSPLKLIDFGLSKIFNEDDKMKGVVGTTFYMAPEVILGEYNEKCDVWACGIILYIMLCGKPPFYSKDEHTLKKKICSMKYDFHHPEFAHVSSDAKDLIQEILVDSESRPSIAECLENKWIKEFAPHSTEEILNINWNHIKEYSNLNIMKKSIIAFTAFRLTEEETRTFVETFKSLDENSDGVLSMDEIKKGIQYCNFGQKFKEEEIIKMFNDMDVDKNGLINFTEFISAMMDYDKMVKKEHLLECFKSYDTDNSGGISFEEFCDMIKPENEEQKKELYDLFKKYDVNGDGTIDVKEFIEAFKSED